MADANFSTLGSIFNALQPSDLVGTPIPNLGSTKTPVETPMAELIRILENNGRGVYTANDLVTKFTDLQQTETTQGVDLSKYLAFWLPTSIVPLGAQTPADALARDPMGKPVQVSGLNEIMGKNYQFPAQGQAQPTQLSVILSRSPFFSPAVRNTKRAEIFLNSMPSTVLSQLVPYMQLDFLFKRTPGEQVQAPGTLHFLLGAVQKQSLAPGMQALVEGHQFNNPNDTTQSELDYAGMEMFTSPQTLVNPTPNLNVGTNGTRYTDVLDPFRPFLTLDHVTITSKPSGGGFVCFKHAQVTLKLHDRSRLSEISDLIRVNVYSGTTVWLTYGWRAPSIPGNNPYYDYVNDTMLMREPYGIQNSSFSFDQNGIVTITLELYTECVKAFRDLRITDHFGDMRFVNSEAHRLMEKVTEYRRQLHLDSPVGLNKEIRSFQVLDAAENNQFPNLKPTEVQSAIASLKKSLSNQKNIDKDALNGLITSLQQLYKPTGDSSKFVFQERYNQTVTSTVGEMFTEVRTGVDPFLPTAGKNLGDEVTKLCDQLNVANAQKKVVSFGKIFCVFALRGISSLPDVIDEAQIFFYAINDQAGPISNHSIANFPILIEDFIAQFTAMVKERGGEAVKLEDFMALCVDKQFTDPRPLGYGFNDLYQPWKAGSDPQLKTGKDKEQQFESRQAQYIKQYGPFKQPQVEMYIETSHQRVSEAGQNDILQGLSYSAATGLTTTIKDAQGNSTKKIMRIHVYDKQLSPYKPATQLLRNENNTGFIEINQSPDGSAQQFNPNLNNVLQQIHSIAPGASFQVDQASGRITVDQTGGYTSNQQIKDAVSKYVPVIKFGSNGSTVTGVNVSSKANPLVTSRNLLISSAKRNTAHPNGSGDLGLPLRIIPAQMTMTSLGNPLATMAQNWFIDFQTGTTLDNLYILTHLSHNFSPGKFETQWTFAYSDAYGVFEGAPNILDQLSKVSTNLGGTSS